MSRCLYILLSIIYLIMRIFSYAIFISFLLIGVSCSNEDVLDYKSLRKQELLNNRAISLNEILSEAVDNDATDTLLLNSLKIGFIERENVLIDSLNKVLNEEDIYQNPIDKNDVNNLIIYLDDRLSFSILNFIIENIFDILFNYLIFVIFVFLIGMSFDYVNLDALKSVLKNLIFITIVGFVISLFFSPSQLLGIVPSDKDKEIAKVIDKVKEDRFTSIF